MKFWEALREMERGAVCEAEDGLYRLGDDGELHFAPNEPYCKWSVNCNRLGTLCGMNWSIHTPAPSSEPSEPLGNSEPFDPVAYLRKGGIVEAEGVKYRLKQWRLEMKACANSEWYVVVDSAPSFVAALFSNRLKPVRETFGFAEAVKLVPGAHVRREGRPNLFLSERITMELGWFSFGENFSHGITKGDLDATDFYVVEGGK